MLDLTRLPTPEAVMETIEDVEKFERTPRKQQFPYTDSYHLIYLDNSPIVFTIQVYKIQTGRYLVDFLLSKANPPAALKVLLNIPKTQFKSFLFHLSNLNPKRVIVQSMFIPSFDHY